MNTIKRLINAQLIALLFVNWIYSNPVTVKEKQHLRALNTSEQKERQLFKKAVADAKKTGAQALSEQQNALLEKQRRDQAQDQRQHNDAYHQAQQKQRQQLTQIIIPSIVDTMKNIEECFKNNTSATTFNQAFKNLESAGIYLEKHLIATPPNNKALTTLIDITKQSITSLQQVQVKSIMINKEQETERNNAKEQVQQAYERRLILLKTMLAQRNDILGKLQTILEATNSNKPADEDFDGFWSNFPDRDNIHKKHIDEVGDLTYYQNPLQKIQNLMSGGGQRTPDNKLTPLFDMTINMRLKKTVHDIMQKKPSFKTTIEEALQTINELNQQQQNAFELAKQQDQTFANKLATLNKELANLDQALVRQLTDKLATLKISEFVEGGLDYKDFEQAIIEHLGIPKLQTFLTAAVLYAELAAIKHPDQLDQELQGAVILHTIKNLFVDAYRNALSEHLARLIEQMNTWKKLLEGLEKDATASLAAYKSSATKTIENYTTTQKKIESLIAYLENVQSQQEIKQKLLEIWVTRGLEKVDGKTIMDAQKARFPDLGVNRMLANAKKLWDNFEHAPKESSNE